MYLETLLELAHFLNTVTKRVLQVLLGNETRVSRHHLRSHSVGTQQSARISCKNIGKYERSKLCYYVRTGLINFDFNADFDERQGKVKELEDVDESSRHFVHVSLLGRVNDSLDDGPLLIVQDLQDLVSYYGEQLTALCHVPPTSP
jgi:hypothetical protein